MRINNDKIDITMYQIERRFDKRWSVVEPSAKDMGEDVKWCGGSGRAGAPLAYEFSACGDCWQQTGEFGTFDPGLSFGCILRIESIVWCCVTGVLILL